MTERIHYLVQLAIILPSNRCFSSYYFNTHTLFYDIPCAAQDLEDSSSPLWSCLLVSLNRGRSSISTFHPQLGRVVHSGWWWGTSARGAGGSSWLEAGGEGVSFTKFTLRGTLKIK